jgi:hypothetical protein
MNKVEVVRSPARGGAQKPKKQPVILGYIGQRAEEDNIWSSKIGGEPVPNLRPSHTAPPAMNMACMQRCSASSHTTPYASRVLALPGCVTPRVSEERCISSRF